MRRLLGNMWVKLLAAILFTVFALGLWQHVLTFIEYVNLDIYEESAEFNYRNSELIQTTYRLGRTIEEDVEIAILESLKAKNDMASEYIDLESKIGDIIKEHFPNGTNMRFSVTDTDNDIVYSNVEKGQPKVASYIIDIYDEMGDSYGTYYEYAFDSVLDTAEDRLLYMELGRISIYVDDLENTEIGDELYDLYNKFYSARNNRYELFVGITLCAVAMLACLCWIMASAGYSGKEGSPKLRFYDKIPLEIFLAIYFFLAYIASILVGELMWVAGNEETFIKAVANPVIVLASPFVLIFFASIANRIKTGTFLKNTVIWWLIKILLKAVKKISKIIMYVPMFWRTVLAFALYCLATLILLSEGFQDYNEMALIAWVLFSLAVLGYLCWKAVILHQIKKGGERIYCGDYDSKIDTSIMFLNYKKFAEQLNSVGNGLNSAVEERMKSERMKSELITNVSHDLKTPLTSIINYVDLLKNEDKNSPKVDEYLEVLDRQSNRLKKLTEDLIFAAKASSGTEKVNLEQINVSEFVRQAIAEYSGKTDKAELNVIIANKISPETTVKADGRLLWRIMDNIFGNVCKYAQPGTRVYVETDETEKTVTISVKNISKEQLNISAEELMQRFVRGDASRSSEGSGLGLSIAKDLAILQDGFFDITVDGDLFKSSITLRKN